MGKLVVYMSMSLDGFIAASGDGPGQGLGLPIGLSLHGWIDRVDQDPEATGPRRVNADVLNEIMTSGAIVTGRHTFDWAGQWGGDHHGVPIYVLTRHPPEESPSAYVTYRTDPRQAAEEAKAAAGDRIVMMHGASAVQSLLDIGQIDEMVVSHVPVLLGAGRPLFADLGDPPPGLRMTEVRPGDGAIHVRYAVEPART